MFRDWQYFKDRATAIVSKENIGYRKITTGFDKGRYNAQIQFPKDINWEEIEKYLIEKYGSKIPINTRYAINGIDKEDAKKKLISEIASHLHDQDRMNTKHTISDVWKYYVKNKEKEDTDIQFSGWVGREHIKYFKILLNEINENNWQYELKQMGSSGSIGTFKEFYYFVKQKSKAEWAEENERAEKLLNKNNRYYDEAYKKLNNYIYDEENIPEIAQIEAKLEGKVIEPEKEIKIEKISEKTQIFEPIKEKLINLFIDINVPHPSRGMVYTEAQISSLKSLASSFENIEHANSPNWNVTNEIVIYWNKLIHKWQKAMIDLLGAELFKKVFLYQKFTDIYSEYFNKYNYRFHPISVSTYCFQDTNGLICKYGVCKFDKKENWTYDNVVNSLTECIKSFDKLIVNELNIKYNKELYDKSLTLKQWLDKYYSSGIEPELIVFILNDIYELKCDYKNYREVVEAYLRDFKETNQPETKQVIEPIVEKSISMTKHIKKEDLYNVSSLNDNGFIKIGYRKDAFLKTPIILGRERVIILGSNIGSEKHKSVFAIVDLNEILASHNEKKYGDTENYPTNDKGQNINDRNYKDDKNSQRKIAEIAEQFEPEVQISTSATAAGLPIITIDGIVVSGNNRIMSMKLMVSDYKENYELYKKTLIKELLAGGYGFDDTDTFRISNPEIPLIQTNEDYEKYGLKYLKTPVLVRIDLDFPEYTTTEMQKYNKETKKVERPIDKAIKLGKILYENPNCFNNISNVISKFENISDLYSSTSDVSTIKSYLIQCGILSTNELPAYIEGGAFTANGKMFLENLMAGMILGKDELTISELDGVKKLKQIIVGSLHVLIKNDSFKDYSLKKYINEAILLQQKLVTSGLNIADYLSQLTAFSEKELEFSEKAYYMNMLLNTGKLKFKSAIEKYNNSAEENIGGSMFGEVVSQDELFDKLFIQLLDDKDKQMVLYVKKFFNKTMEQPIVETLKVEPEIEKKINTKEDLIKLLKALEIQNKYKPSESLNKRINALKILIKYKK